MRWNFLGGQFSLIPLEITGVSSQQNNKIQEEFVANKNMCDCFKPPALKQSYLGGEEKAL